MQTDKRNGGRNEFMRKSTTSITTIFLSFARKCGGDHMANILFVGTGSTFTKFAIFKLKYTDWQLFFSTPNVNVK